MASWNDLFLEKEHIAVLPQPEIFKFIEKLALEFDIEKLKLWDLCCGAGRHVVLASSLGHDVYGSDLSENGIKITREWLEKEKLEAHLEVVDMVDYPWHSKEFHGVFSWDALHHNTLANIEIAVEHVRESLIPGGLFMAVLCSTSSGHKEKRGEEIEKETYIRLSGEEKGVPHHYFDEAGIRALFKAWEIVTLVEQVNTYVETEVDFYKTNPFAYTKWGIMVKKI